MERFSSDESRMPPAAAGGPADDSAHTASPEGAAFGEFLRQAREKRQLTLEQIASDTKISPRHLTELEKGNVGALPHGMYRRAMLRAYADSVGLDKTAALQQFERTFEATNAGAAAERPRPEPPPPAASRQPALLLAAVAVGATLVVALIGEDPADQSRRETTLQTDQAFPAASPPRADTARGAPIVPAAASAVDDVPGSLAGAAEAVAAHPAATGGSRSIDPAPAGGPPAEPADMRVPAGPRPSAGQLVIESEPEGARVTVNGVGWGVTPAAVAHVPFGAKRIRVTLDGYAAEERLVTLAPAQPNASVRVRLSARD
jgi:transcriptional regulator with XRE-family HTH domain